MKKKNRNPIKNPIEKPAERPVKKQVHPKFYTGDITPKINELISYIDDDYVEIQRATYSSGLYLFLSIFFVIFTVVMLWLIVLTGQKDKAQGYIFLLVIIIPIFVYQAFVMIKTLIFQPCYQPIVFHRKQSKVYIYRYHIDESTDVDEEEAYPNEKRVFVTDWLRIHPNIFTGKIRHRKAIVAPTTYALSITDRSNHLNIPLLNFDRHFNPIENEAYLKGIWNWLALYMQYDRSLAKPTVYTASPTQPTKPSKLWPATTLAAFEKNE